MDAMIKWSLCQCCTMPQRLLCAILIAQSVQNADGMHTDRNHDLIANMPTTKTAEHSPEDAPFHVKLRNQWE